MLFFKRAVTAFFSFIILFIVLYFIGFFIGGLIAGANAYFEDPNLSEALIQQAGEDFAREYFILITVSAFVLSGILSGVLAFGGILPWCKREQNEEHENPVL